MEREGMEREGMEREGMEREGMESEGVERRETDRPVVIRDNRFRFDSFSNGEVLFQKKKGHLPAMGWNSWNAFGSGNTEELTKAMADRIVELELNKSGYSYVVLDDGCYKPERVDGLLKNEEGKFPSGFRALADYIHAKGLKFGMYNDIGSNLCAGAAVGTWGHEKTDAKTYLDWGVDFIKVDNCYYLWDNATFSSEENAKYTYAPKIRGIRIRGKELDVSLSAAADGTLTGKGAFVEEDHVTNIGTFDGTGPEQSPIGSLSGELEFAVEVKEAGDYDLTVCYAAGKEIGFGSWLQVGVGEGDELRIFYDDLLPGTEQESEDRGNGKGIFTESPVIRIRLKEGKNRLRLMNHRRQENTLSSYAALQEGFCLADPFHDVILSICEWGKTQPQNWGYKVGDSWRILNDITFRVGADGDPGVGSWESDYTPGVAVQYNKAVIMDEFAGLDKGWNDPDMLMIGMNGLDLAMCRTHMTMWCMMNAPLMLGLDLRRVKKGDDLWQIISNEALIGFNQDPLGIQAKRIYSTLEEIQPDKVYLRDNNRVDVLAKPLSDGSVALSFINLSGEEWKQTVSVSAERILSFIGKKMPAADRFKAASSYWTEDVWTGEKKEVRGGEFSAENLTAHGNVTLRIRPV